MAPNTSGTIQFVSQSYLPQNPQSNLATILTHVDVKVNLVQPNHTVDMISNLWKRAKPISQEDIAGTSPLPSPSPFIPH